jgi:hypothetical protein
MKPFRRVLIALVGLLAIVHPTGASAQDAHGTWVGGLGVGAAAGTLLWVSSVTLRANAWNDYPEQSVDATLRSSLPWIAGGAVAGAFAVALVDGSDASHLAAHAALGGLTGAAAGWVAGLPSDKTAGGLIGLGTGFLVAGIYVLTDAGDDRSGAGAGVAGGVPVLLFRWRF